MESHAHVYFLQLNRQQEQMFNIEFKLKCLSIKRIYRLSIKRIYRFFNIHDENFTNTVK